MNTRKVGSRYEKIACDYLSNKGYRIIERNYRNRLGEIDIVAETPEGVIVYCEVKYRSGSRYGTPFDAVDYGKRRRIGRTAALHFSMQHYNDSRVCRFDVVGIYGDGNIEHIENAFDLCR